MSNQGNIVQEEKVDAQCWFNCTQTFIPYSPRQMSSSANRKLSQATIQNT